MQFSGMLSAFKIGTQLTANAQREQDAANIANANP